jgi:hypothetical protein
MQGRPMMAYKKFFAKAEKTLLDGTVEEKLIPIIPGVKKDEMFLRRDGNWKIIEVFDIDVLFTAEGFEKDLLHRLYIYQRLGVQQQVITVEDGRGGFTEVVYADFSKKQEAPSIIV